MSRSGSAVITCVVSDSGAVATTSVRRIERPIRTGRSGWSALVAVAGALGLATRAAVAQPCDLGWAPGFAMPGIADPDGPDLRATAQSMVVFDDGAGPALYVGGAFRIPGVRVGATTETGVAKWDGYRWTLLPRLVGFAPLCSKPRVAALIAFDEDGDGPNPPHLYAGGYFQVEGGPPGVNVAVARWNGTAWEVVGGGLDHTPNVTCAPWISSMCVYDPDGPGLAEPLLVVGGLFDRAGGVVVSNLAAWDGENWSDFGGGANGWVRTLLERDGHVYAGGEFTQVGLTPATRVAQWTGGGWSPLGVGLNDSVTVLEFYHDKLYAGGEFTRPGVGATVLNRVARWDPIVGEWLPLATGIESNSPVVHALRVFGDELYVGGHFLTAGGVTANGLARWNDGAGQWFDVAGGVEGADNVYVLEIWDNGHGGGPALYVGGDYLSPGPIQSVSLASWDGARWHALGNGIWPAYGTGSAVPAAMITWDDGLGDALYVGGRFISTGPILANGVSRWHSGAWSALGSGLLGSTSYQGALAFAKDGDGPATNLYAGGTFLTAGGVTANHVARWDGEAWSPLGTGMNNSVYALAWYQNALYAGGLFTNAGGVPVSRIARWDGEEWADVGGGVTWVGQTPWVSELKVWDEDGDGPGAASLYVGGHFRTVGGLTVYSIARWDGEHWHELPNIFHNTLANLAVTAMTLHNDGGGTDLYVAYYSDGGAGSTTYLTRWTGSAADPRGLGPYPGLSPPDMISITDAGGPALCAAFGGPIGPDGAQVSSPARFRNGEWSGLIGGCDYLVHSLGSLENADGATLFVGGEFNNAGNTLSHHFAAYGLAGPIVIVEPPTDQFACPGAAAQFVVTASGGGLSYAWRRNGVPLADGGNISGASTRVLRLDPAETADEGEYDVVISQPCGEQTSPSATLTILSAPVVVESPVGLTRYEGETANFAATVSGSPPPTLVWLHDDVPLVDDGRVVGATTSTLTIAGVVAADAGAYRLVAGNNCGQTSSPIAALTVEPSPCGIAEVIEWNSEDPANGDHFGVAVATSGDWAVVGADGDDERAAGAGAAYVFQLIAGHWMQVAKLTASDAASSDLFGFSVAIAGDTLVIGARGDDDRGPNAGSAYVFENVAGVWTQTAKLLAADGTGGDALGWAVALAGDTIFVGAPQDDDLDASAGAVYVFRRTLGTWSQADKLLAVGTPVSRVYGEALSVAGQRLLVGARGTANPGGATGAGFLLDESGGEWTQVARLTSADASGNEIGSAAALAGDTAVLGARSSAPGGVSSGAAYVFTRNADGTWSEAQRLTPSDSGSSDEFGSAVAIVGNRIVVGGPFYDLPGSNAGAVYVFDATDGFWSETTVLQGSDITGGEGFGQAIAASGDTLLIGADFGRSPGGATGGSIYQFDLRSGDPIIDQPPANTAACAGRAATLAVTASGLGQLAYLWRKDGVALVDDGRISGAATAILNIDPVQPADAGTYDAVVLSICGAAYSAVATLTVHDRGDANCDGLVDFFDIDAFLQALFDPTGYAATFCGGSNCAADIDCDGGVDFFDIDPFLACLFSACPPCP